MDCQLPLQLRQCQTRILLATSESAALYAMSCITLTHVCADGVSLAIAAKAVGGEAGATIESAALYPMSRITLTHTCADGVSFGIAAKAVDNKATATCESAAQHIQFCITLRCDAGTSYHASNHPDVMMLTDCCLPLQPRQ